MNPIERIEKYNELNAKDIKLLDLICNRIEGRAVQIRKLKDKYNVVSFSDKRFQKKYMRG